jgi:hypothetical protein
LQRAEFPQTKFWHHPQQQEQTADMVRKTLGAISESLGWSKTDLQLLFPLLCKPEQLQVSLKYHASQEAKSNGNRKYRTEKKTLVKFAMEALEEHDQKYIMAKTILSNEESSKNNPKVRFIVHFVMACQKPGDIWKKRIETDDETKWMCQVTFDIMKALD